MPARKIVYRVEKDGIGPYRHREDPINPNTMPLRTWKAVVARPCPTEDGVPHGWYDKSQYRFGFKTKAQYRKWFTPKSRELLAIAGFKLAKYHVDGEILEGNAQVAFYKPKSTLLSVQELCNVKTSSPST